MSAASASTAAIPHCAVHPEVPARTICERCGGFCCEPCVTRVHERVLCAACAALPGVNYLETIRLKFWGRRDSWAWYLGGWGVLALGASLLLGGERQWAAAGLALAQAVVDLGFFFRQRWARWGLLAMPAVVGLWLLVTQGPLETAPALLLLGLGGAIFADTRNQLFFQLPVKERALHRLWDRYENNPLARSALLCGMLGLLLPPLAVLAVILGAMALRRVDPEAYPPIGRKAHALGAMLLGMGSLLVWMVLIWPRFLAQLQALT